MNTGKNLDDILSENIQYYRNQSHLTQAQLAEKLNLSISHIANIEGKKSSPSLKVISKILDFFEITPNDLFLDKEPQNCLSKEQQLKLAISENIDSVKYKLYEAILNLPGEENSQPPHSVTYHTGCRPRKAKSTVADSKKR